MAREFLNDAERYLLEHWAQASQLEEAMEEVRNKYKTIHQRVLDTLTGMHPDLNETRIFVTQFWGPGYLGIGKSAWPRDVEDSPSGFWVQNLRLEVLADEDEDVPSVYLWFPTKAAERAQVDLAKAKARLARAAEQSLAPEDRVRIVADADEEVLLRLTVAPKTELLRHLAQGDGREFVATLVRAIDCLYPLVATVDDIFRTTQPPRSKGRRGK